MGVIVTFNYPMWVARYPEFSGYVLEPQATSYFTEAGLYVRNDGGGPVNNVLIQTLVLNMLTAHIAMLSVGTAANPVLAPPPVGRVSDATEGSVHAAFEMNAPGSAAWFMQTQYGAAAWQALAPYRTMRYVVNRGQQGRSFYGPGFGYGGY
jgi:Protein of unknown function (DUF4054)